MDELDSLSERIDFLLSGDLDYYDYQYLSGKSRYFISMLCNAISVDSLSEEQAAELMNSLRQQMMRLPDQDQLKTCSVELRILMDH